MFCAYSLPDLAVLKNCVVSNKTQKTWVLYFAYPVTGLSHCLAKDKQLDSPRRDIDTAVLERTEYNTPKVDASVAISSWLLNLRDSVTEDNVRKRPFPQKF